MNIAVVPARGGSKRIARKNIRAFCGKPVIAWSIEAAIASGCFERIVVSTDDEEIAAVAVAAGAEAPFRRPAALADDHTATLPVIRHAIEVLGGPRPAFVCCVYPAAPLLGPGALRDGLARLLASGADYAFPVARFEAPIQRALRIGAQGRLAPFFPDAIPARSQDLEPAYHDAGQFYWGRTDAWLQERPILAGDSVPVVLPRHLVQDIDTPEDWAHAERLFAMREAR